MNRLEIATRLANAHNEFLDGIKFHPGSTAEAEAVALDQAVMFACAALRSEPSQSEALELPASDSLEMIDGNELHALQRDAERWRQYLDNAWSARWDGGKERAEFIARVDATIDAALSRLLQQP